jgi:acyl carrier protein
MTIEQQLRQFVNETFMFGRGTDEIAEDDSFVERGVIDSTGVLELVNFLETQYQITLNDWDLVPANLDSFRNLTKFVERKLASSEGAAA